MFLGSKLSQIGMIVEIVIKEITITTDVLRQLIRVLFKIAHCLEARIILWGERILFERVPEDGFSTSVEVVGWIRFFFERSEVPSCFFESSLLWDTEKCNSQSPNAVHGVGYSNEKQGFEAVPSYFFDARYCVAVCRGWRSSHLDVYWWPDSWGGIHYRERK